MTPDQLTAERTALISHMDALVDTYGSGDHGVDNLLTMRRGLAVTLYRLAAHIKQVYGEAGLSYMMRKYRIAEAIVDARASDAKKAMNILEQEAMKMPSVVASQKEEIWAEAEKEALKSKIDVAKQVLAAMQQELAFLTYEYKNTSQQNQGA